MRALGFLILLAAGCSAPQPATESALTQERDAHEANSEASTTGQAGSAAAPSGAAHPCNSQDGKAVTRKLKALGTEPFWAADVEGRCVTYRTPQNQSGIRIWTQMVEEAGGTVWNGAIDGRQFQLRVKPASSCSDGMSDRVYPMEAVLRVMGETRRGCASP